MLPDRLRRQVDALGASVESLRWHAPDVLVETATLTVLSRGCRDGEQVRFDYADKAGNETRRLVEPHKLVTVGHRWYLVAWDLRRDDWRTFRVDRTSEPRLAGVRFTPRELPAPDAASFVADALHANEVRIDASVLLHVAIDEARPLVPRDVGTLEPVDAARCRFLVAVDNLEWLAMRLALLDADFTVERPRELAAVVRRLGARLTSSGAAT
jgi:predicted DNA-binding transcriptional regulator YafY